MWYFFYSSCIHTGGGKRIYHFCLNEIHHSDGQPNGTRIASTASTASIIASTASTASTAGRRGIRVAKPKLHAIIAKLPGSATPTDRPHRGATGTAATGAKLPGSATPTTGKPHRATPTDPRRSRDFSDPPRAATPATGKTRRTKVQAPEIGESFAKTPQFAATPTPPFEEPQRTKAPQPTKPRRTCSSGDANQDCRSQNHSPPSPDAKRERVGERN